jgi:hypothetical protein
MYGHTNPDWHRRIQSAGGLKAPSAVPTVASEVQPVILVDDLTTQIDPGSDRRECAVLIDVGQVVGFFASWVFQNPLGSGLYVRCRRLVLSYTATTLPILSLHVRGDEGIVSTQKGHYIGVLRSPVGGPVNSSIFIGAQQTGGVGFNTGLIGKFQVTQAPVTIDLSGIVLDEAQSLAMANQIVGVNGTGFDGMLFYEELVKRRQ